MTILWKAIASKRRWGESCAVVFVTEDNADRISNLSERLEQLEE